MNCLLIKISGVGAIMKKILNRSTVLVLLFAVSFCVAMNAQAGPSINDLTKTNLANFSTSPFHLNTDRYNQAFQTIGSYLSAHDELPSGTILIADNHGHFLRGIVTDWTYYTYGTHKGIELYVFNPEDGSQFLTIEIWLPKEQQRNIEKKESYITSFRQIEDFLTGSAKYRLDLVFQDEVPLDWGNGYNFKLDDEGISLSFTVNSAAHPKAKMKATYSETTAVTPTAASTVKTSMTPQATMSATVSATASVTPTVKHHKKKKSASASATATAEATVVATATAAQ
jgi:hypothetical protein